MSPEEKITLQGILRKFFNDEWFEDFLHLIECGQQEAFQRGTKEQQIADLPAEKLGWDGNPLNDSDIYDPFNGATAWFWTFWNLFKMGCAQQHIILDKEEVLQLFRASIPYPNVWRELLETDDDFRLFKRMKLHREQERSIAEAPQKQQKDMHRLLLIRNIIEGNLLISGDPNTPKDRVAKPFNDELAVIIKILESENIPATPRELALIINNLFHHIPRQTLQLILQYRERLEKITHQPKVQIPTEPSEPIEAPIVIRGFEIDPEKNVLVFQEKSYIIGFQGLIEAFEALMSLPNYQPMDFYNELKILLNKIHQHCQKANILKKFQFLVYKLQEHYKAKWDRTDKSVQGLKIAFTYSALGLKHAEVSEFIPMM